MPFNTLQELVTSVEGLQTSVGNLQTSVDNLAGADVPLKVNGTNGMLADLNLGGFRLKNAAAGTVTAPSIYPGTDSNTGIYFPAADEVAIATGGVERIRITSTGKVGIGTSAPYASLDVVRSLQLGNSATATNNFHFTANDPTAALQIWNGNNGSGTERVRLTSLGQLLINRTAAPVLSTELISVGSSSGHNAIAVDGGNTGTGAGSFVVTRAGGSTTVAIGNWSAIVGGAYDDTPTLYFSYAGRVANLQPGAGVYAMKYDAATSAWTFQTSSARYKDNIENSSYGLQQVLLMRPVTFTYKAEPERRDVGFIAEEMVDIVPELVGKNAKGQPDAVDYDKLSSVLCKAIQELNAKVESLQARIAELES